MKIVIAAILLLGLSPLQLGAAPPDLGHGINFGNFLEAPHEGDWGGQILADQDFALVKQAGFTTVRVPIAWAAHTARSADFTIDPAFMARIDWVVAEAQKYGLNAILDYHNDAALMKDPDGQAARYLAIWKQIATHFKDAPPTILFELLNEPNHQLDAPHWNALLARALVMVRADNPHRAVVIGPTHWNSPGDLKDLVLPENDRDIIVTFHYYNPLKFTHQGASWMAGADQWKNVTWNGTPAETQPITTDFDRAAVWGAIHHRPLFLGEFGAYEKGDMASRARWTTFVARSADARGIARAYWEFSSGFGAYDPVAQQWRQPLLQALLPEHAGN
jgi:endoglucanase